MWALRPPCVHTNLLATRPSGELTTAETLRGVVFVRFFSDRLSTFLVEKAMEKLPYRDRIVETSVGVKAVGKEIDAEVSLVELK